MTQKANAAQKHTDSTLRFIRHLVVNLQQKWAHNLWKDERGAIRWQTIYGGWRSTEDSLMNFRLLERRIFNSGQRRGFFNLYGRWQGPQLVMQDRGEPGSAFRSGLKIERASVTLDWGPYSDFKAMCAANAPAEP